MGQTDSPLSAVEKACLILRELSAPGCHRLSTVVSNTGLNKTTVIRLLDTLVSQGLVQRDPASKRYELGAHAWVMSAASTSTSRLVERARPSLARLAAASGDAACLVVATGHHWVCIARHEGSFSMQAHFVQVGRQLPLCLGSAGLAILAASDEARVDATLAACAQELERYSRVTLADIHAALALARERGYAASTNVVWEGTGGISAALPESHGMPYAALSITAMAPRIVKRRESLGRLLLDEVARLQPACEPSDTSTDAPDGQAHPRGTTRSDQLYA